jgi:hypothetical protein
VLKAFETGSLGVSNQFCHFFGALVGNHSPRSQSVIGVLELRGL